MTRYEGSPIAYDVAIHKNVMIPMRDGVRTGSRHLPAGGRSEHRRREVSGHSRTNAV